ncbi:MAG: hypothetical protein JF886_04830 [Candidatus Dormibacteraeota bacterium]|uniref:DUF5658 domain-containing protein n=1 Tax=Candidatus Aeolococcus gillhamiae TaxID=3127015 RepID=A0A2W5Z5C5_9BACT|nr:hypothetical protein [Candidatus Dormibacteraeota bacterium]PZR77906.1 MAG: hypothetical protein DLM65_14475 [Candidatus Dormibacter sp. RRmetagenome_bin12]
MATGTDLEPRVERRQRRVGVGIVELVPDRRDDVSLQTLKDNLRNRVSALLVAIITAAQLADVLTTLRALGGHTYVENNPLFRALIVRSPVAAYSVKLLIVGAMVVLVLSRLNQRRAQVALAIAAGLSITAPLLNFLLLIRS